MSTRPAVATQAQSRHTKEVCLVLLEHVSKDRDEAAVVCSPTMLAEIDFEKAKSEAGK
jgi:hypothetical protein